MGPAPNGHAANSRICCRLPEREEVAGGQGSAVKDGQSPDLHLGLEGVQTGPGTDRSPSGTVRRGASSLLWLRVRGERRAFWHLGCPYPVWSGMPSTRLMRY